MYFLFPIAVIRAPSMSTSNITNIATLAISNILNNCIKLKNTQFTIILYDTTIPLCNIVKAEYHKVYFNKLDFNYNIHSLTSETYLSFKLKSSPALFINVENTPISIFNSIVSELKENDILISISSQTFQQYYQDFKLRIDLGNKKIKCIDHVHLTHIKQNEYQTYFNALNFNPNKWIPIAKRIKDDLDKAKKVIVSGNVDGTSANLEFGQLEPCLMNTFDDDAKGSFFPIGEVFSESRDLSNVNGTMWVNCYPNLKRVIEVCAPFKITVQYGIVTEIENAPEDFMTIMNEIRKVEGDIYVREFGLGLNDAISTNNIISDPFAFERMAGLHLSLGKRHTIFKKRAPLKDGEGIMSLQTKNVRRYGRFHIDIFAIIDTIILDEKNIKFKDFIGELNPKPL